MAGVVTGPDEQGQQCVAFNKLSVAPFRTHALLVTGDSGLFADIIGLLVCCPDHNNTI